MSVYAANREGEGLLIYVPRQLPVTVVVLDGRLTMETVARLRQVLTKCLVACPDALVIDVANLTADSDLPLTVFRVVQRHAASWPAVPVVLAAPSPNLRERLARTGLDGILPTYGSRAEAVMRATGPPTIARADWDLVAGTAAPGEARALLADACEAWGVPQALDAALIVVSELVTNAVVHASGAVRLTVLLRRSHLHLVVRDASPDPPRRLEAALRSNSGISLDAGGRGLPVLDAVCRSWGHVSSDSGKAVWGIVDVVEPGQVTEELSTR
jgi:anti-sigma regulatory factor (Ser/Thr protein kinase)/anti-anti-sigma regulatory factor